VPPDRKAAELRKDERARLLDALTSYALPVTGDAGFPKAEVSGGGVPLHELRLDTLESRKAPGVFLCGELIDAFGRIGGFNFLLAWCTGRLAGLGAAAAPMAAASTKSDAR
jgi:predicted flavoprotein YhiN